jgi:hypothetical protein
MGERVMFLSPFHCGNQAMKAALKDGLFDRCFARVPFSAANYEALLTCYRDTTAAIPSW